MIESAGKPVYPTDSLVLNRGDQTKVSAASIVTGIIKVGVPFPDIQLLISSFCPRRSSDLRVVQLNRGLTISLSLCGGHSSVITRRTTWYETYHHFPYTTGSDGGAESCTQQATTAVSCTTATSPIHGLWRLYGALQAEEA